jgi:PAS domain-containing protein
MSDAVGLFTWDLVANKVSGDTEIARLFVLDPEAVSDGLSVETMIGRIHPDDRARVAKALHDAIVDGTLFEHLHRVEGKDGRYVQVLCMGRCFGYENGLPSVCFGFVCEIGACEQPVQSRYEAGDNILPFKRSRH